MTDHTAYPDHHITFGLWIVGNIGRGAFDLGAMRARGYAYERLDQLTMDILLGVR